MSSNLLIWEAQLCVSRGKRPTVSLVINKLELGFLCENQSRQLATSRSATYIFFFSTTIRQRWTLRLYQSSSYGIRAGDHYSFTSTHPVQFEHILNKPNYMQDAQLHQSCVIIDKFSIGLDMDQFQLFMIVLHKARTHKVARLQLTVMVYPYS